MFLLNNRKKMFYRKVKNLIRSCFISHLILFNTLVSFHFTAHNPNVISTRSCTCQMVVTGHTPSLVSLLSPCDLQKYIYIVYLSNVSWLYPIHSLWSSCDLLEILYMSINDQSLLFHFGVSMISLKSFTCQLVVTSVPSLSSQCDLSKISKRRMYTSTAGYSSYITLISLWSLCNLSVIALTLHYVYLYW